jgi:hypothetical protein
MKKDPTLSLTRCMNNDVNQCYIGASTDKGKTPAAGDTEK